MQQQLACQKQELLLLRTEAERQWQMHEQAVCSQLQLGQVTQGQQHQLSGQQQQVQWQMQQMWQMHQQMQSLWAGQQKQLNLWHHPEYIRSQTHAAA